MTDDMIDEQVNTTHRYGHYCRAVSKDGRKCSLYSPHEGDHLPKHGIESDRFTVDD